MRIDRSIGKYVNSDNWQSRYKEKEVMKRHVVLHLSLVLMLLALYSSAFGESEFFKQFKHNYNLIDEDLNHYRGEMATVKDFVYKKDIGTLTLTDGRIIFARYVQDRPTAAIFIGKGNFSMNVPTHVGKETLVWCSGDSTVNEDFEFCFIRMADDFDLKLREKYTFEEHKISWKEYNTYKQEQGEFFFKPTVEHEYDNYFQLLRSVYERKDDGYFWVDLNRYVFNYDPNRPQQVSLAYEHEGGSMTVFDCVKVEKESLGNYDDLGLSYISFPTTLVKRSGGLEMGGLDGAHIPLGAIDMQIVVNRDSLRFLSAFLHYNFTVDSVRYNGGPADFWRRGDFSFFGIILPEYVRKNDTANVTVYYHGKDYTIPMPFVKNPLPSAISVTFTIPDGFNYLMPDKTPLSDVNGGREKFSVEPDRPYRHFYFQPVPGGFDTVTTQSETGMAFSFLKSAELRKGRATCLVPDDLYESTVVDAFSYWAARLGPPLGTADEFVFPDSMMSSMPGLMEVNQTYCWEQGTGDFHAMAGTQVARQWFGSLMQPISDRETWFENGIPDYLSLMYVQYKLGAGTFYSQMLLRRNLILIEVEKNDDLPIGIGSRLSPAQRTVKGAWLMHMLRFLMFDLEGNQPDLTFLKFVRQFAYQANNQPFSNKDFVELAEQYYGDKLDWFFRHWLFGRNVPEYNVEWSAESRSDGNYVIGNVITKAVEPEFKMPVIIRVESADGQSAFFRPMLNAGQDNFELGPLQWQPSNIYFNEFYSVLSKDNVKKK